MNRAIGIDLGGTNIKAALIDCGSGAIISRLTQPTRDGEMAGNLPLFAVTVRALVEELESGSGGSQLPVGISAPGLADPGGSCIRWMPGRMHGLEKLKWSEVLDRPAQVLNDAQAALLGEVWVGAARGCKDVFMLTLGTGVGGAVYSGGRLLKGVIGRAGHLGHISIDAGATKDVFNTPGSLESKVGNQTLQERAGDGYENTHALVAAMEAGDEKAASVWQQTMRDLAVGIASLVNVLDPELVIIGGGIASGSGERLFAPLREYLDQFEWRPGGHRVRLAAAAAGEWAGCIGAAYSLIEGSAVSGSPHAKTAFSGKT